MFSVSVVKLCKHNYRNRINCLLGTFLVTESLREKNPGMVKTSYLYFAFNLLITDDFKKCNGKDSNTLVSEMKAVERCVSAKASNT